MPPKKRNPRQDLGHIPGRPYSSKPKRKRPPKVAPKPDYPGPAKAKRKKKGEPRTPIGRLIKFARGGYTK